MDPIFVFWFRFLRYAKINAPAEKQKPVGQVGTVIWASERKLHTFKCISKIIFLLKSSLCYHTKAKATYFFVVPAVGRITLGRSVGKIIIIIINLRVRNDTSKNKNIDHGVKETCAIMSKQATYEIDHICLLRDSTISRLH